MGNVLNIAKKEFSDLLGNRILLMVMAVYICFLLFHVYNLIDAVSQGIVKSEDIIEVSLGSILCGLTFFGMFVAVILGFSVFASDRYNNTLNTLLVKPLYRDTIINGKLLGALCFLICICGLATLLYLSGLIIVFGNIIGANLLAFLPRLLLVFVIVIIFMMIYFALSMLISLIVKNQALALILSMLSVVIFELLSSVNVAEPISLLFGANQDHIERLISELTPYTTINSITDDRILNPSIGFFSALGMVKSDVLFLVFYMVIPVILSYIVFLRRDVS